MSNGLKFLGKDPQGNAKGVNTDELGNLKSQVTAIVNGVEYPVRWEIDDTGNAALAIARVDGLGYDKDKELYRVENNGVDVFDKGFSINGGALGDIVFDEIDKGGSTVDISKYKSFDITIRADSVHTFSWSASSGFRSINGDFGEFTFFGQVNINQISDIIYQSSTESNSANHSYLVAIGVKVVQGGFRFRINNESAEIQNYHAELRLYK